MTNIFELHQNVWLMTIALVTRTHANLMFVSADQRKNAQENLIYVEMDSADVVRMMNVHP